MLKVLKNEDPSAQRPEYKNNKNFNIFSMKLDLLVIQ